MAEYAWYKLNENAASTAVADSSGNERHGTASANTSSLALPGGAFNFAATYSVDCGHIANLTPNQDMSFACWTRHMSGSSTRCILDHRHYAGGNWSGFALWGTSIAVGMTLYKQSAATAYALQATTTVYHWHFICATIDRDGLMSLYVNDVDPVTIDISAHAANDMTVTNPFKIGVKSASESSWTGWPGYIDEVKIYDYVLTANEVRSMCHAWPLVKISGALLRKQLLVKSGESLSLGKVSV